MDLEHTSLFDEALRLLQEGGPFIFITGRAGTGKSTLLKHFRETTAQRVPVLAPTGVAALNVDGETIHRFFRFAPGITAKEARGKGNSAQDAEIYRNADLLIIDEISMVRADLLDCVDQFLRAVRKDARPFGGLRIVAIGDLYQLPPVVTSAERDAFAELYESPYFFASQVMKELMELGDVSYIELEKVYRQSDPTFISILNAVRNRRLTENQLQTLNTRVQDPSLSDAIVLTSVNAAAEDVNEFRLAVLRGDPVVFTGDFQGKFPEQDAPASPELCLKKGARVMCVANDQQGRFVNGSLGWVVDTEGMQDANEDSNDSSDASGPAVTVKLDDGSTVSIQPYTWTIYRTVYDKASATLEKERVGSFSQIPLKLAWAVTIHKSQGKTFDRVTIDLGTGAFAARQTYVALSRCRSLEGITLIRPVRPQDIRLDPSIARFIATLQSARQELGDEGSFA
jgi:ATP-dependent exoDNAse (exonuclease V) alpha subunit